MNITPGIETQPAATIKQFQEAKLAVALAYLSDYSTFYQRMFNQYRIDIKKIRTLKDLTAIPFTEKSDLQTYNKDFICVPQHKIIDYITTSGDDFLYTPEKFPGTPHHIPSTPHDKRH